MLLCFYIQEIKKYKLHLLRFGRSELGKLKGKGRKIKKTMICEFERHIIRNINSRPTQVF